MNIFVFETILLFYEHKGNLLKGIKKSKNENNLLPSLKITGGGIPRRKRERGPASIMRTTMKKILLLALLAWALVPAPAAAQHIALGEKVPDMKNITWHRGREPQQAPMRYVEFFHSSARTAVRSLEHLAALSERTGKRLTVVVIAQESPDKVMPLIGQRLTGRMAVGFDPEGRLFAAYGVSYLPFGVLTDSRGRALWMGNTLQLDEETLAEAGGAR